MSKIKAFYCCHYDGNECDKVVPKFDDKGYLIPEPNDKIKDKYGNVVLDTLLNEGWDICDECKRNYSLSAYCYGTLKMRAE